MACNLLSFSMMKSVHRFPLWLSCLLFFAVSVRAQIIISEFMADNKKTLADEDGQFPDWIEIYNTRAGALNLGGLSLTDDPAHSSHWPFPTTTLAANGFMVIFASGKHRRLPRPPLPPYV